MSPIASAIVVLMISCFTLAQRGSYAGKKPVGYPQIVASTTESSLGDRFGEEASTTTQKLPLEALGDRELINRLSKLPVDKQPFWFLNWQALEDNRKNPQTYQPNPNSFVVESTNQALPSNQVSSFLTNQAAVTNLPTRNNIASNNVSNGKVPATNLPNAQFASLGNTGTIVSTGNDGRIAPNGQNFPARNQGQIGQTNNGQISSASNDKQRNINKQRN